MRQRRMAQAFALPALVIALTLCQPSQAIQDARDQWELRRLFSIPQEVELVAYEGYPPMVGFGQREGLAISAAYRLRDTQESEFLARSAADGWSNLPIPATLLARIPFSTMLVPLDGVAGVFRCRTAGDDVLHARSTRPCQQEDRLADMILGVLDTLSNTLYVVVRSGY